MKKIFLAALAASALFAANVSAEDIAVRVNTGKEWKNPIPQCVVWIEDGNGNFVQTLAITQYSVKKAGSLSGKERSFPHLPVWYTASGNRTADAFGGVDAVTTPTPKAKNFPVSGKVDLKANETYVVKVEVNHRYDYNDTWVKENTGSNGQPSVVYSKSFVATKKPQNFTLDFEGPGDVSGKDGNIHNEYLDKLTTAKNLIASITVDVK